MSGGWVYIMTNKPDGTLYVGVTANLESRVAQHKLGTTEGFSKRYNLHRLVYAEHHDEIEVAIHREKRIKHWPREWKVKLIVAGNPDWDDLYGIL
jgi:putative endonuclease